jgi:hypothetical protein
MCMDLDAEVDVNVSCMYCDVLPLTRMVSLVRIITEHHYISNNCKVIHHIHIARITVSYYTDSSITT